MSPQDYLGVLVLLVLGISVGVGALSVSRFLGARRYAPKKEDPYECGIPSVGAEGEKFSVKFYLVAVSFILFDIETVFLMPLALTFRRFVSSGEAVFVTTIGGFFVFVVTLGLIYEWRKGLLDWNR